MSRNKYNPFDCIGKTFGSLFAKSVIPSSITAAKSKRILCVCVCGKEKSVAYGNLVSGGTMTCGCRIGTRIYKHGMASRDHDSRPAAYGSWISAKERCFSVGSTHFADYGGRGIKMCERWRNDFTEFFKDLGERPDGYTLERIDVNGDYEPGNCKWIPASEQMDNQRCSLRFVINGVRYSAKTLAPLIGRSAHTLRDWHYKGIAVQRIESLRPDWSGTVSAEYNGDKDQAAQK